MLGTQVAIPGMEIKCYERNQPRYWQKKTASGSQPEAVGAENYVKGKGVFCPFMIAHRRYIVK